ncbi:MAG: PQQ-binding-like beta-propeller repeat protein [Gemmataceae bacterium]
MRCSICTLLFVAVPLHAQENWPQFRGPTAAVAPGVKLEGELAPVWTTPIHELGRGWSSPIVWKDRVYLTFVKNDKTPKSRPGLYIEGVFASKIPGEHEWSLACFSLDKGELLWKKLLHKGEAPGAVHIKNSYASETPVTDGERVYAYFGNLGLFCTDMDGKSLWTAKPGTFKTRYGWGTAASPVLHNGKLYIVHDNEETSFLIAYNVATGKELFRTPRAEKSNWATPFIWENRLRTEIVTCGTQKVRSYDLDGKLLWELTGMSTITIPTPSARRDMLYIASGYVMDASRPIYAIRPGAEGDISLGKDETSNKFIAWSQKQGAPYHPSPLLYDGRLYVVYDKGFLACFDAATGKEVYAKERIDPGRDKFTASPVAAAGRIFIASEEGDLFVLKAGPKFEAPAKVDLKEEMCLATPALVRDSVIVRTDRALWRLAGKKGRE